MNSSQPGKKPGVSRGVSQATPAGLPPGAAAPGIGSSMGRLVLAVVANSIVALAGLLGGLLAPLAAFHLLVAAGILPLIFGAMLHFVPVLTRTGEPSSFFHKLPWGVMVLGWGVSLVLAGWGPRWLLHLLALLLAGAALALLFWMRSRARACLGSPHPGWRWYGAALACLTLALLVVPPLLSLGVAYWPLRSLHLHLNTLGFVGLAALGTLPLLLPTVLGRPDPDAVQWLRRQLVPSLTGILLLALGAALVSLASAPDVAMLAGRSLAVGGAVLLAWGLLALLRNWWQRFGFAALLADGAAVNLLAALSGFLLLLFAGALHGLQLLPPRAAILAFGVGFLLPLVLGALSQLLPVWCYPGPVTPQRGALRLRLVRAGRVRAGFALLALTAALLGQEALALGLAVLVLAHFLSQLLARGAGTDAGSD